MDEIALVGDTSKPTLYARFGSKQQLYERVTRFEADAFVAQVFAEYESVRGLPIRDAIATTAAAWFAYFDKHPDAMRLLFAPDRSPAAQQVAEEVGERITERVSALIEQTFAERGRKAPRQARFLAAMVFGAAITAARDNPRGGRLGVDEAAALYASFVYAGHRGLDPELLAR